MADVPEGMQRWTAKRWVTLVLSIHPRGDLGARGSSRQLTTNTVDWLDTEVEGWIATRIARRERHTK